MERPMTEKVLQRENVLHADAGGTSYHVAQFGFRPAFFDFSTVTVYRSRFANGQLAPFHLLDGLPDHLVVQRDDFGRVVSAKPTLVSGFERNGYFFTRDAASKAVAEWSHDD